MDHPVESPPPPIADSPTARRPLVSEAEAATFHALTAARAAIDAALAVLVGTAKARAGANDARAETAAADPPAAVRDFLNRAATGARPAGAFMAGAHVGNVGPVGNVGTVGNTPAGSDDPAAPPSTERIPA